MVVTFKEIDDIHLSSDSEPENEVLDKKSNKKRHKKLIQEIDAISGVTKKRSKKTKRNEPSQEASEFSWSTGKSDDGKVGINDLVGCLETDTQKAASMKKKLRIMNKTTKTLEKPLHKPEQQRVERTVAFEETSKDISKWNDTVQKNRAAEHLSFPLAPFVPRKPNVSSITNFKPQNDLEREINEVLKGSQYILERKDKELTAYEEEALKNFDLKEALERRKELQKTRALQSYYEAKCRRQKKIKSKKYRRILKKEKEKSLSKVDLDILSKDDPELFKNELEKAEKLRAVERASLRHRNSSKWAKNLITKGKPNKEDQERIREQLRISRQLTDHKALSESEDELEKDVNNDDDPKNETNLKLLTQDNDVADNPWLLGKKDNKNKDENDTEDYGKLKRPKAIITNESKQKQEAEKGVLEEEDEESSGDEWEEEVEKKSKKKKRFERKKNQEPAEIIHNIQVNIPKNVSQTAISEAEAGLSSKRTDKKRKDQKKDKLYEESDAMKYLKSNNDAIEIRGLSDQSDDEIDDVIMNEQRMNIRDAFANDDVIEEFVKEKESIIEHSKPKSVDLTLPGWGSWGGTGLKVTERKRKRFTKEERESKKRRDEGKSNVIISETRNKSLAKYQVSEVPFPYRSAQEFERSIRQPIGQHWNTPGVVDKLIEPRITTAAGAIIDPIKPTKKIKQKGKARGTKDEKEK